MLFAAARCAVLAPRGDAGPLFIRAPDLARPLTESYPTPARPEDPVKLAVLDRINRDRGAAGLSPVAWDEASARVADAFCAEQIREGTRGHFLMNGIPPYARTGLAGIFGMGAENSIAWTTSGTAFHEPAGSLALAGHADMMAETPPNDGHRRTILDPDATHVGVGWAQGGGQFRMAEEFLTRRLAVLTLQLVPKTSDTILFKGQTRPGYRLDFTTLAHEPSPRALTKAQANARVRYGYPEPRLAYVPEGMKAMRMAGAETEDRLRIGQKGDFSFRFAPALPGLWTILFYASEGREKPRPSGSAVVWIEKAAPR